VRERSPRLASVVRVAVYTRISDDDEGLALGVKRQESDCRSLVKLRGCELGYVASDNSVSAYKDVVRREFERVWLILKPEPLTEL
jgi:site-specific DNA recombinase